ncbi:MAG TPA: DNA polymerase III subunit delta, partial [Solirubrobacteraceae bacterium]|nr:DNA polymerase III subunit delta [Solirubrobacteraceae bacterium]
MPAFKPAYLIHGDDHGRIGERRARLRALAEAEGGAQGVEVFEGERAQPDTVARALSAMTFVLGRRFIVVDGVERWKDKDLEALEATLANMPPDTTVAFFAREEGRLKVPARLVAAVKKTGGDIAAEATVKPWELPKWVAARARELGLELDGGAARALVTHVGERQQRLLRELEKLALELGPGGRIGLAEVEERTAPSAELRAWTLADALVAGDEAEATRAYLALRAQGERLSGLLYMMAQRLRTAVEVARALEAGQSAAEVKRSLRMPSRAADRLIADVDRAGADKLRRALESVADLEVASRGGGPGGAGEDTEALLA